MSKPLIPGLLLSADSGIGEGYSIPQEQLDQISLDDYENPDEGLDYSEAEGETNSAEPTQEEAAAIAAMFDIDGEQVDLDTIRQWKQGNMMQSDYTKKTQEIAQARKQMEDQFAPYRQLDDMLRENPQLEQQFIQMLQQAGTGTPDQQGQQQVPFNISTHPQFQQMQQQLEQQQQYFQQMQEQQTMNQIKQEWDSLRSKYPDIAGSEKELAAFADQNGLNLEQAYMIQNFNNVREKTAQEMVQNNMRKKAAATISPKNNAKDDSKPALPDGGYENLVDFLMKKNINLTE